MGIFSDGLTRYQRRAYEDTASVASRRRCSYRYKHISYIKLYAWFGVIDEYASYRWWISYNEKNRAKRSCVGPLAYFVSRTPITDRERFASSPIHPSPPNSSRLFDILCIYIYARVSVMYTYVCEAVSIAVAFYFIHGLLYIVYTLLSLIIIFFTTIMNEIESTAAARRRRRWEAIHTKRMRRRTRLYV